MLSVIIPCKDEEKNIQNIYNELIKTLKDLKYELIFIDDGSSDGTMKEIEKVYELDPKHVKGISFSRNFKKDAAIYAGLENCIGEYACVIDADLQQNPNLLIKMLEILESNPEYDEVAMVQKNRKRENIIMRFFKNSFYFLIDKLSDVHFVNGASDFRMFRRNVIDSIIALGEKNRFSKGIFSWIGFNIKYLEYEAEERKYGKTKFNFKSSIKLALEGILAFSVKPLRIATYTGILSALGAFIYILIIIIQKIAWGINVDGYASIMCIILLLGGIQLITIGILGEYLARTYTEVKNRPIYIAKKKIGF